MSNSGKIPLSPFYGPTELEVPTSESVTRQKTDEHPPKDKDISSSESNEESDLETLVHKVRIK